MDFSELKERVKCALNIFYLNEKFLLENDLNERSLTHKLAEYIKTCFPEYDVDCEYNRMPVGSASDTKKLYAETIRSDDSEGKAVYPDVIVHKRGNNDKNLLVIEVKKETNLTAENKRLDRNKVEAYCVELSYSYGLFLVLSSEGAQPEEWYEGGSWSE